MLRCYFLAAVSLLVSVGVSTAQAPNSTPAPAATESPAQETMEDPQVGDHWTYDYRDDITGDVKWNEVNELLDTDLPLSDDWDSIGGLMLAKAGHIPNEGEAV